MAKLLIITGPPGAGKSTVARVVTGRFERSVLVDGDAFFGFIWRGGITPWLQRANEQNEIVTQGRGCRRSVRGRRLHDRL